MNTGPGALNRFYRLIWNETTHAFVPVAETSHMRRKRGAGIAGALVTGAVLLHAGGACVASPAPVPPASALPTGGQVNTGAATIARSGNTLNITQSTPQASLNWTSFNIGAQSQVNFLQPSTSSVALNRVVSADPSSIFGSLSANGSIILVNPNGIVFGPGSKVDVGSLIASTLNLTDEDFRAGRTAFSRNGATGSVTNYGNIQAAAGGHVALLAANVSNQGTITANLGTVALAAGDAVTLDMSGRKLLGIKVDPATVDALVENQQLIRADGGQVIMTAGAANRLLEQAVASGQTVATQLVVQDGHTRLVSADGTISAAGGKVELEGNLVDTAGKIDVGGKTAGEISISADFLSQSGGLHADSSDARGGAISLDAGSIIQTAQVSLSADGTRGGGAIEVHGASTGSDDATASGRIYSSANMSARGTGTGADGGRIAVSADSVQLRAATLDASGTGAGGDVLVGGGFQGKDSSITNAVDTGINGTTVLRADAGTQGDGGKVVVWSDDTTTFAGQIYARGGSQAGNGGTAEVSSKGSLTFGGGTDLSAAAGADGHLTLDPRDIVIDNATSAIVALNLDDPNVDTVNHANEFGQTVNTLTNGNVLVTAPTTSVGGISKVGATYLFNSRTGALLAQLYGTQAQDEVGSGGVKLLANGNYLVFSPLWNQNTASATFYAATSLFNYTFTKTTGTGATAGALTWQNGTPPGSTGTTGASSVTNAAATFVGTSNSLLGSNLTNDRVGNPATTSVIVLTDGNLAIATPMWNSGRGAVTWMNAGTGQLGDGSAGGDISSTNSLVGTTPVRDTAIVETSTAGNHYYVLGGNVAGPTSVYQSSTSTQVDPLSIGAGDLVGTSLVALPGGAFAVVSPTWTNVSTSAPYAGAVTWVGPGNRTGVVSISNSLVGTHAYDAVGGAGITLVGAPATAGAPAPDYLVDSPYWKSDAVDSGITGSKFFTTTTSQGAVTWVNGSNGDVSNGVSTGAAVSANNSLVGNPGNMAGALYFSTAYPYTYAITANNANYEYYIRAVAITTGGIQLLSNGNALVRGIYALSYAGAVTLIEGASGTFGDGSTAAVGSVSAANSLVGNGGDEIGSAGITELSNHNYVVSSPRWSGSTGAVTLVSGTTGQIFGASPGVYGATVSSGNSLTGSVSADQVASGGTIGVGIQDATTHLWSNYLVLSPNWGNSSDGSGFGSYTNRFGAVTWGNGSTGAQGQVSAANSLVGDHPGDYVGSSHLSNGIYISTNTNANGYDGLGTISPPWVANLTPTVDVLANGNYVVRSADWSSGRGAATWGSGTTGVSGTISSSNSLTGTTPDVYAVTTVANTHADGRSYNDQTYTLTTTGDHVGLLGVGLPNGSYVAVSPFWGGGRGALTWINATGTNNLGSDGSGVVSSANSLVGATPDVYSTTPINATGVGDRTLAGSASVLPIYAVTLGDHLGVTLESTQYFDPVYSTLASDSTQGMTRTLSLGPYLLDRSSPTFQAGPSGTSHLTGYSYAASLPQVNESALANGNFLIGSSGWNNIASTATQAGAVTFGSLTTGLPTGVLSASNSLVGGESYDRAGRGLVSYAGTGGAISSSQTYVMNLANGNYLVLSPGWNNGTTFNSTTSTASYLPATGMGEVTWGSGTTGVTGVISSTNSLIGGHASDNIGANGVIALPDGNYVVSSVNWASGTATRAGASTWGSGTTGVDGTVSATNSLIGSVTSDSVGNLGVTVLADGNYVVSSDLWANGTTSLAGAVTWVNGANGDLYGTSSPGGLISATNSLVGTHGSDIVGSQGVKVLAGGNYVVDSSNAANGTIVAAGAVTFGPAGGIAGAVGADNSLVGSTASDRVGFGGGNVQLLTDQNGTYTNYLVTSAFWTDPSTGASRTGAVTWVNGATGYVYGSSGTGSRGAAISAYNSLVGNNSNDSIGSGAITPLQVTIGGTTFKTGDAITYSTSTQVGDLRGAVTLIPGATGLAGRVSWRNSIIGFNNPQLHVGPLAYTVLPYAATGIEDVSYRPLIWTSVSGGFYSDNASLMALSVVNEQTAIPTGTVGSAPVSTAAGDGPAWSANGAFLDGMNQLTAYGYSGNSSNGILAFAAQNSGVNAVITPAALSGLLNAGTNVLLEANNNISVLQPVTVAAGGHGGNLTLEAGRSIQLFASVSTDNGNFTALANESAANGVLSTTGGVAQWDGGANSVAKITMAPGVTINAGTGNVVLDLLSSTDKTKTVQVYSGGSFVLQTTAGNSSSDITLGNISATNITVDNSGGPNTTSGNVLTNAAPRVSFLETGGANGTLTFSAWQDVILGQLTPSQSIAVDLASGASGQVGLVLDSNGAGGHAGAVSLTNVTANTYGGAINIGGGALGSNGLPTGVAYADGGTRSNLLTRADGVSIVGASTLAAGGGSVTIVGDSNYTSGSGVYIAGTDVQHPNVVSGGIVTITAEKGAGGTSGSALTLSNATLGGTANTSAVNLDVSGFDSAASAHGSVVVGSGVSVVGGAGSILTVASDRSASAEQIGGTTDGAGSGFWLAADDGTGSGGNLGGLLRGVSGFQQVVLGRADQTTSASVQNMNLVQWSGGQPLNFNLEVLGGAAGLSIQGAESDFSALGAGDKMTLAVQNGGLLNLGTGTINATLLELAASGSGSAVAQGAGAVLQANGLLLTATGATVNLTGAANNIATLAGSLASGQIVSGTTLTVDTVLGISGLTSTGNLFLQSAGASSDIVLNQPVTSQQGNLTLVAGEYFKNNVMLDQGLLASGGQYWVYSQAPTTLADGTTGSRGMDNFSKRYGADYSGSVPSFASQGNWFLYGVVPVLTVTPPSGTVTYGDTAGISAAISKPTYTGFIDNDTAASTGLSGSANLQTGGYTPTAGGLRPAGSYSTAILDLGTLADSTGYAFQTAPAPGALTVVPATLTITANNVGKVVGQLNPPLTFSVTGLQNGDSVSDITGITLSEPDGSNLGVGEHTVVVSGGANPNYTITDINGILTVRGGRPESDTLSADVVRTTAPPEAPINAESLAAQSQDSPVGAPGQLLILADAVCGSSGNTGAGSPCGHGGHTDGHAED